MTNKNSGNATEAKLNEKTSDAGDTSLRRVVDPAANYYEESRRKREAYNLALRQGEQNLWFGDLLASQPNHPVAGEEGTPQSRSGFDYRTFRKR